MEQAQILNNEQAKDQEKAVKVATEIALKSHDDSVFLVTPRGAVKLEKGKYGGWLLRPPLEGLDVAYGVWCYGVERKDDEQVKGIKDIQEKVAKVASTLGISKAPLTSLIVKKYRVVKAVLKKTTERYAVYEIEPTDEEATATLAYVHYYVWWSRRGKCHGEICGVLEKFSKLLKAEFKDAEVDEAGVYVSYDISALVSMINKLMSTATETKKEAAEKATEETTAKPTDNEEATTKPTDSREGVVTYFIVVKLPPDSGDVDVITKLEEAVKQKLKELNIAAAVWSVRADV